MKFVCTECDEPMKFDQNGGLDEDGSMSATFRCPSCEWGVTLLINSQETQMVRSLGVPLLGRIPFDPRMAAAGDRGTPYILAYGTSPAGQALFQMGERVRTCLEAVHEDPVRSSVP